MHVDRFLTFFRLEACSPLVQILSYQPFLAAQFLQFFQIELLLRDQLYWPELIVLHVLRYLTLQLHKPKIIQIICISNMVQTSQKYNVRVTARSFNICNRLPLQLQPVEQKNLEFQILRLHLKQSYP